MDHQQAEQRFMEFRKAYGHTLFTIDREKKILLKKKKDSLVNLEKLSSEERSLIHQTSRQKCIDLVQKLKEQLSNEDIPEHEVLKAAEFLHVGNVCFQEISQNANVPYIIPFLGHKNLILSGTGEEIYDVAKSVVFSALRQTAPGQINISVYNPELRDTFSCFADLEQYTLYSAQSEFIEAISELSKEIVANDALLKGKHSSLLELREKAKQPVGQLRLFVVIGEDWLHKDALKEEVLKTAENAIRAGCTFIFVVSESKVKLIEGLLNKVTYLNKTAKKNIWKPKEYPQLEVKFSEMSSEENERFLNNYVEQAEKTAVVTIPFSEIEDIENYWKESSAEGISFSLGKVGLDKVTLCLGDEKTQLHNVLITGAPGKGKSNLLEVMIHSLCCRYSPEELELYLLDFKDGLTFKPYCFSPQRAWLPHAKVLGIESARDFGVAVLEHIEVVRRNRALQMNQVNANSVAAFREKCPDVSMPRIVLLIDEYQKIVEINDEIGRRAAELIENIVRQGRACGIHMVLASQTVAHGAALMGREDQIYPAFPVRIALQNSLQESFATFVQGNDAAAKLRVRGEAVMNVNYGAIDSNQKLSVAYAEPLSMTNLRKQWCSQAIADKHIPLVFSKNDDFKLLDASEVIKKWRRNVVELDAAPMLLCGQLISVERKAVGVRLSRDAGRNVAILGSGDGERVFADAQPFNYAIGLIESMAVTLALQHPNGDARFILINGLENNVSTHNGVNHWLRLMERFGFPVEQVTVKQAPEFFVDLAKEMKNTTEMEESCYIFVLAMDRCSGMSENLNTDPLVFETISGSNSFQEILKSGPPKGIHTIAWWANVAAYKDHLGFNGDGYIDTKILLRLDDATSKSVLGPFINWDGAPHRAYIHDATDLQSDSTMIPMSPFSMRDTGQLEAVIWE